MQKYEDKYPTLLGKDPMFTNHSKKTKDKFILPCRNFSSAADITLVGVSFL